MSNLRVLISGASIAGPTAAYWFAKAGADVTVVERFPSFRTGGQAVDIRTAGVTVMRMIPGMEEAVRAKTTQLEGISLVRNDGRPYGTITATGDPNQQSLVSEYEIYRGDLSKIVYDLTKDHKRIRYVFGEQIASIQQDDNDGPARVTFANNKIAPSEYDLVVACDGATSRTRGKGLDCHYREHLHPLNSWSAFFSIDRDLISGSKIGKAYSAPGGRFIAVGMDPDGVNKVCLMGIHPRNKLEATRAFREATKHGDEAIKQAIAQEFRGAGWVTDEALTEMMVSKDFYAHESAQVKVPTLYKGRFAMAGDAGYAPGPTGCGTTLALVGAYLLAGEVLQHKGNVAAGLQGYEEQMRPIINEMQKIPPFVPAVFAPQTRWGVWLRNSIFPLITWSNILHYAQKFFGSAFASSDEYKLPKYDWTE